MKITAQQISDAKATLFAHYPDKHAAMNAAGIEDTDAVEQQLPVSEAQAGFSVGVLVARTILEDQHQG